MEDSPFPRSAVHMDKAERACSLRDSGYTFELYALRGELRGDLRSDLIMTEEAEQEARGSQARAGDQGRADQPPSLHPVLLDSGRPAPGDLLSHKDVVEAADAGACDFGDTFF